MSIQYRIDLMNIFDKLEQEKKRHETTEQLLYSGTVMNTEYSDIRLLFWYSNTFVILDSNVFSGI